MSAPSLGLTRTFQYPYTWTPARAAHLNRLVERLTTIQSLGPENHQGRVVGLSQALQDLSHLVTDLLIAESTYAELHKKTEEARSAKI